MTIMNMVGGGGDLSSSLPASRTVAITGYDASRESDVSLVTFNGPTAFGANPYDYYQCGDIMYYHMSSNRVSKQSYVNGIKQYISALNPESLPYQTRGTLFVRHSTGVFIGYYVSSTYHIRNCEDDGTYTEMDTGKSGYAYYDGKDIYIVDSNKKGWKVIISEDKTSVSLEEGITHPYQYVIAYINHYIYYRDISNLANVYCYDADTMTLIDTMPLATRSGSVVIRMGGWTKEGVGFMNSSLIMNSAYTLSNNIKIYDRDIELASYDGAVFQNWDGSFSVGKVSSDKWTEQYSARVSETGVLVPMSSAETNVYGYYAPVKIGAFIPAESSEFVCINDSITKTTE